MASDDVVALAQALGRIESRIVAIEEDLATMTRARETRYKAWISAVASAVCSSGITWAFIHLGGK
jgi:hypothetical protein